MFYFCLLNEPTCIVGVEGLHDEKNRQLHIILAIIVSVFSACVIILVAYMVIFPASYTEGEVRTAQPTQQSKRQDSVEVSKVKIVTNLSLSKPLLSNRDVPNPNNSAESEFIRKRIVPFLINRIENMNIRIWLLINRKGV